MREGGGVLRGTKTLVGPSVTKIFINKNSRISNPKRIAQALRERYDIVCSKPDENCLVDDPVTLFWTSDSESPCPTNIDYEHQDFVTSIMRMSND